MVLVSYIKSVQKLSRRDNRSSHGAQVLMQKWKPKMIEKLNERRKRRRRLEQLLIDLEVTSNATLPLCTEF